MIRFTNSHHSFQRTVAIATADTVVHFDKITHSTTQQWIICFTLDNNAYRLVMDCDPQSGWRYSDANIYAGQFSDYELKFATIIEGFDKH